MKKLKHLLSLVVVLSLSSTLLLSGCGMSAESEEELLTAEQRAALNNQSGTTVSQSQTSTASSGSSEGFEDGALIGISLPWMGTQNWVEAGTMFTEKLEADGFKVEVNQADQDVEKQKQQIEAMVDKGAKVIVIGPVDGSVMGSSLEKAKKAGTYILGYDRLLENTSGVDGVIQFGSIKTGVLQAEALLEGLEKNKGEGPYNIELFGGGPKDPNAPNFFSGALTVLQPLIDNGSLNVISGQTDFSICATEDWSNPVAQARMDSILSEHYTDAIIDGVLCPNDGIARAVITACIDAGQDIPVVSGLDAETETVKWIWEGKQYSTVAKPTDALVSKTIEVIKSLKAGNGMPATDVRTNNGAIDVLIYELPPVVVTKENAKEAFVNDPERYAILK